MEVLLIVTRENQLLRVDSIITLEEKQRIQEICANGEQIAIDVKCKNLEVCLKTESGALIHMHT